MQRTYGIFLQFLVKFDPDSYFTIRTDPVTQTCMINGASKTNI